MSKFKKIELRIRRAESYVLAGLIYDLQIKHPEFSAEIAELKQIIRDMCGGNDGIDINAALFMPFFTTSFGTQQPTPFDHFPQTLRSSIHCLLRDEVKNESSIVSHYKLSIPSSYTADDLNRLLASQIEQSEMIGIYDYVQNVYVYEGFSTNCYNATMYYAINNSSKHEKHYLERIKKHIQANYLNVIKSLNEIAILPFNC